MTMSKTREDFSTPTKRIIALRSGYRCAQGRVWAPDALLTDATEWRLARFRQWLQPGCSKYVG